MTTKRKEGNRRERADWLRICYMLGEAGSRWTLKNTPYDDQHDGEDDAEQKRRHSTDAGINEPVADAQAQGQMSQRSALPLRQNKPGCYGPYDTPLRPPSTSGNTSSSNSRHDPCFFNSLVLVLVLVTRSPLSKHNAVS